MSSKCGMVRVTNKLDLECIRQQNGSQYVNQNSLEMLAAILHKAVKLLKGGKGEKNNYSQKLLFLINNTNKIDTFLPNRRDLHFPTNFAI